MDVFNSICRSVTKLTNGQAALKANKKHLSIQHKKLAEIERLIKKYNFQCECNEEEIVEHINKLKSLYSKHREEFNDYHLKEMFTHAQWQEIYKMIEVEPNAPANP